MLAGTVGFPAVVGVVLACEAPEEPPPQPTDASASPNPTTPTAAQLETVLAMGDNS
jgi:hypothetical protein